MKKASLLLLLICNFIIANCQDELDRFRVEQEQKEKEKSSILNVDSIVTNCGLIISKLDTIKAGVGTMPDGSFKWISIASGSLFRYVGGKPNEANSANAMQPGMNGFKFNIHRIDRVGNDRIGYKDYIILKNGNIIRYMCDINNAIASGEIEVPEKYRPKQKPMEVVIKGATLSLADEILKLKKLLDDGIITKEEFEAMKKKLIEKKD